MALVEAIIGKFRQQLEDGVGLPALNAAFDGARNKALALLLHFLAYLLAHRLAQQVGFAERIAGHDLRDLHHLFLIDDDAESFLQDRSGRSAWFSSDSDDRVD